MRKSPEPIPTPPTTSEELPPRVYAVSRAATEFLLRGVDVTCSQAGDNLHLGLVYTAIWTGNVRHITRSEANMAFGGIDDIPADEFRVPVRIRETARALHMPYETVRRYANQLVRSGTCMRVGRAGLIVPAAVHRTTQTLDNVRKSYVIFGRLIVQLKRIGLIEGMIDLSTQTATSLPPATESSRIRAMLRLGADYFLRAIETMADCFGPDLTRALVYTTICASNVKHLENDEAARFGDFAPDADRQPVSILAVAQSLRMPYETVRQHATQLLQEGRCERRDGRGLIVPQSAERQPDGLRYVQSSYQELVALIGELKRADLQIELVG